MSLSAIFLVHNIILTVYALLVILVLDDLCVYVKVGKYVTVYIFGLCTAYADRFAIRQ